MNQLTTLLLLLLLNFITITLIVCPPVFSYNTCPNFRVEYDVATRVNYVKFDNKVLFEELGSQPRVPLLNFKHAYTQCFDYVNVSDPLVINTMYKDLVIPYSLNSPPNVAYCRSQDLFTQYCNQYATLSIANSCNEIANPNDKTTCHPPYCYPCAENPTGLGTASHLLGSCVDDVNTGKSLKLYACYPLLGCTKQKDCVVSNRTKKETPEGLYVVSDKGLVVYDNSANPNPIAGYPCCSMDSTYPNCGFQDVSCTCKYCGEVFNFTNWAYIFLNTNRREIINSSEKPTDFCTNSFFKPLTLFFTSSKGSDSDLKLSYYSAQIANSVSPDTSSFTDATNKATVTNGRITTDQKVNDIVCPAISYQCIDIYHERDFKGDTVRLCTKSNGQPGLWSKLKDVVRQRNAIALSDNLPWWGQSKFEQDKIGDWDNNIKSLVIYKCTQVTLYSETEFYKYGNMKTIMNKDGALRIPDVTTNYLQNIRSLIIERLC